MAGFRKLATKVLPQQASPVARQAVTARLGDVTTRGAMGTAVRQVAKKAATPTPKGRGLGAAALAGARRLK